MPGGSIQDLGAMARLRSQLQRVKAPVETAASLPPACYSDETFYRQELKRLFHEGWFSIGRADRWKEPGDYAAFDLAGVPTIVLRDKNGELRAHANTCRHRGALLLEGEGQVGKITCPFHGWTYDLDGCLRGAPKFQNAESFDKSDYGLPPFRVEVRDGFAFLCFVADGPTIDDWLGDFSTLHAPWSLGDLVTTHRREFEVACNWKPFLEVFSEWYHLPFVHSKALGDLYAPPDAADEVAGCYATQFGQTHGSGGVYQESQDQSFPTMKTLQGRNRLGGRYSWVFPNLAFSANPDSMWVYEAHPIAPDRCRVVLSFCFPPETVARDDFEARAEHYYHRLKSAVEEDIPMLERQQRGLSTPYGGQGRFCAELEPTVGNFACWYAERMLSAVTEVHAGT